MLARTIETRTHGRYLVEPPAAAPALLVAAFHGYAESAEQMLARLRTVAGGERRITVAVQGLNRFYQRRTDEVIAGWMTRQDRELAIADNVAYVNAVLDAAAREWTVTGVVFAGFSQGTSMAFRAAAGSTYPVAGVIAVGGDIPPEISEAALRRCARILLCRGSTDEWYTAAKFAADIARVRAAASEPRAVEFDGGHEWNDAVSAEASRFLKEIGS